MSYCLYICVDDSVELQNKYQEVVQSYNEQNKNRQDSGFDIYVPENIIHPFSQKQISVNHKLKALCIKTSNNNPVGYYMYPRSSISKTRYRMANSVGIIDSGYRGNLIAKLDVLPVQEENVTIEQYTRLFQICSPDLSPFENVYVVNSSEYPFNGSTSRGDGGFGSTST
jgi:dUTP pyrophosphatase